MAFRTIRRRYQCGGSEICPHLHGRGTPHQDSYLSEEIEEERVRKKKFTIPTADEPGHYPADELKRLLKDYLGQAGVTAGRIREVLFPSCLAREIVTREELKQELISRQMADPTKAGLGLAVMSLQMGMLKNDFLRQVISYEYPVNPWEKDNYRLRSEYRELVTQVLKTLNVKLGAANPLVEPL